MPGKITISLVLIAVGAMFLIRNLGYLSEGWWQTTLKLWPLILVFIGLEVLLSQRKGGSKGKRVKP